MADNNVKRDSEEASLAVNQMCAAVKDIQVEVVEDFDRLAVMQAEWDAFVEAAGGEIFLTYDWCRVWWKHYGGKRKLRIFIFRYCGSLVGIFPLFFETIWLGPVYVRTVKVLGTDFTLAQVCLPVQTAFLPVVMERFFAELCSIFQWDIVCLGPLAGKYRDIDVLHQICCQVASKQAQQWCVKKISSDVQTYFELGESWKEYLADLSKRERDDIKRNYNLLAKTLGIDMSELSSQEAGIDTFDEIFADFVRAHQIQWKEQRKLGHFGDWPDSEAFHREVAQAQLLRNRLRLQVWRLKEYCLGYEYSYAYGKNYLNFSGARPTLPQFARISMGKIVFNEMVKRAIAEGVTCIDSLQGRYEHKLRLGGKLFPIYKIRVIPPNIPVRFRVGLFRFLAKALHICYYKIWFGRLAPRLPLRRGALWKIWIRTRTFA